jgi:hypothetical protein
MIDFTQMIGALLTLKKPPHQEVFEAQICRVSANGQFVNLKLSDGSTVWEDTDQLQFAQLEQIDPQD